MSFSASMDNLPRDVQDDLNNGFILTDIDDRYQRCIKRDERSWEYRSGTEDQNFLSQLSLDDREGIEQCISETINVDEFSECKIEDAISGYYEDFSSLIDECGDEGAYMLVAECYFENEVDFLR